MSGQPAEQAKAAAPPLGVYVHVPFCASTCDFCAFYQKQPTATDVDRFLAGIEDEAELVDWTRPGASQFSDMGGTPMPRGTGVPPVGLQKAEMRLTRPVTTVFWGGGTPGLLAPRDLARLAASVRARCGGGTGVSPVGWEKCDARGQHAVATQHGQDAHATLEWTVELAPASVTEARLAVLREAGVTRVSMGVQSFQPMLLDALGRQHTREQIFAAYERVRAAGFPSVNLDLMFALPGQTAAEWAGDVREAVALAPDHLSTYCLTFEEDTKLWVKLSQGRVKLDVNHEADLYEATWAQLAAAGYAQYEVSNFARPGHACRHNLNTWHMHEWIGLGPSAASQHAGWRGGNVADLEKWLAHLDRGERVTEDRVRLMPALLAEDALIFGLRMNAGVDLAPWRTRAPEAPWPVIEDTLATLAAGEFLTRDGDIVRLTNRGRLVADSVGTEIMAAFEPMMETS